MIDENGDLHVMHFLDGLDSLYGVSMTFQLLNTALCGLQQKPMESARAYYNRMVQIMVILRECHGNRYRLGECPRMSKDCFYIGLLPENHPMVVHLKDQPHTTPLDLLRVLSKQEENDALTRTHYPPSTSARPSHPPPEASRALPPTVACREKKRRIYSPPYPTGHCPSGGGTRDRPSNTRRHNGCPGKLVQQWVPHRPLASH